MLKTVTFDTLDENIAPPPLPPRSSCRPALPRRTCPKIFPVFQRQLGRAKRLFRYNLLDGKAVIQLNGTEEIYFRTPNSYYIALTWVGKGGYGSVYKAQNLENGSLVAIKILHCGDSMDAKHESFVHMLMDTLGDQPIQTLKTKAIIIKWIEGRTLEKELLDPLSNHLPSEMYQKAINVIQKLHSAGWKHGDTNTGNFIVTRSGEVTLIDYGNSRRITNLQDRLDDFRKLAANVHEELQFRQDSSDDAAATFQLTCVHASNPSDLCESNANISISK